MPAPRKKYAAIHTTFYTVYKYGYAFGGPFRAPEISFPDKKQADDWLSKHKNDPKYSWCKLGIEEMPATIKAWDGKTPE